MDLRTSSRVKRGDVHLTRRVGGPLHNPRMGSRILFVCLGNTCRSPLAAALAHRYLPGIDAESAGIAPGGRAADLSVTLAKDLAGSDISAHQPRNVRDLDLDGFDLIVAMDPTVATELVDLVPDERLITWTVRDPVGGTLDDYRQCADQITGLLAELPT